MPRKRTVTRYVTRARRAVSRRSGSAGIVNNLLAGAVAGVAAPFVRNIHPLAPGAAYAGIGWFMKNPTLQTLGGLSLAQGLVGTVSGGGSAAGGGWY